MVFHRLHYAQRLETHYLRIKLRHRLDQVHRIEGRNLTERLLVEMINR